MSAEPAPASPALRASLAEQLAQLGRTDPPEALLDVGVQRTRVGDATVLYVRPRDWQALRAAEKAAGRDTPYWAVPWPSGLALARTVLRECPSGARVLELGCGLGLPSVAAARSGAEVLATDGSADAAVFAAHTLALNDLEGETAHADWQTGDALVDRGPWDLVIAADVFYTRRNVELLVELLPKLLRAGGEAWLTDPGRSGAAEFLPIARRLFSLRSERDDTDERVTLHRLQP